MDHNLYNESYLNILNIPSAQFADIDGKKIFLKFFHPEVLLKRDPIILMHDSLGCTDMWRDFPQRLSDLTNRTVISYDRMGFGQSSKREELPSIHFVTEEAQVYLPKILDAIGIDKFYIFGHSVGGGIAVASAAHFQDRCLGIITESAQAFVEDKTVEGIKKAEVDFADQKVFGRLEKYHGDKTTWVLDAWIKVWLSPSFANWSLKDLLPNVKCPLLAIHGDKDDYGSNKFPEMISELAGGVAEKMIVDDCGHVPHREKADLILEKAAAFFNR